MMLIDGTFPNFMVGKPLKYDCFEVQQIKNLQRKKERSIISPKIVMSKIVMPKSFGQTVLLTKLVMTKIARIT
jgi:hypothetical protein